MSSFSSCAELTIPLGGTTSTVAGIQTVELLALLDGVMPPPSWGIGLPASAAPDPSTAAAKALPPAPMADLRDLRSCGL